MRVRHRLCLSTTSVSTDSSTNSKYSIRDLYTASSDINIRVRKGPWKEFLSRQMVLIAAAVQCRNGDLWSGRCCTFSC